MCIAPSDRPCPEGEWHEERDCLGSHCFNIGKECYSVHIRFPMYRDRQSVYVSVTNMILSSSIPNS